MYINHILKNFSNVVVPNGYQSHLHKFLEWMKFGRELWRSSSLISMLDQPEQVSEACVQSDFRYLQGWRPCNLCGPPFSTFHPCKKAFSYVQMELPVFQFVSIASCPFTGHH